MQSTIHQVTSRSEIENWQKCRRAYFWRKIYGGNGIVPSFRAVPLVSGSAVHKGVETMLSAWEAGKTPDVDVAVRVAKDYYAEEVKDRQLGDTLSERQQWTKREQSGLVAALIRAWHKVELPRLQKQFELRMTEKSTAFTLDRDIGIRFMAKADALLLSKADQEPYVYSLKTMKEWSERSEKSYATDLQGITESLAVHEWYKELNYHRQQQVDRIKLDYAAGKITKEKAKEFIASLPAKAVEEVMGVRFCFLVKGKRWPLFDSDGNKVGKWTDSPFLVGYYREGPMGMEFAHSNSRYAPENKSGYGKLGKGWEKFWVYDGGTASKAVGGIKGWIELLASGEVQPDLPSPLETHVLSPEPRFPGRAELASGLVQIRSEAVSAEIGRRKWLEATAEGNENMMQYVLDEHFQQTRRSCQWPLECDYWYACFKASPGQDLLDPMSLYEPRQPHHDIEKDMLEGEERD